MKLSKISPLYFLFCLSIFSCSSIEQNTTNDKLLCHFPNIEFEENFNNKHTECGANVNPTKYAIGGGLNYTNISKEDADRIVYNSTELIQAINEAKDGDIIFLDENSIFDLTNAPTINITKSILLASKRTKVFDSGALIVDNNQNIGSTENDITSTINISSSNVRITGLRIQGPQQSIGEKYVRAIGLSIENSSCVEIDNCEIFNWPFAGVHATDAKNIYVHHNNFHHCQGWGLGYGVVLYGNAEVLVEANTFRINRHDIAGSGNPGQKYIARYNIITENSTSNQAHSFDMHCDNESKYSCKPPHDIGGSLVQIYNNDFLDNRNYALYLRGNPEINCWVENNNFSTDSLANTIRTNQHVNKIHISNNCYNFH